MAKSSIISVEAVTSFLSLSPFRTRISYRKLGFKSLTSQLEDMQRMDSAVNSEDTRFPMEVNVVKDQKGVDSVIELLRSSSFVSLHTQISFAKNEQGHHRVFAAILSVQVADV